ncbi:hypothetical protein MYIN104542_29970 [Mycobacterium intermedium]
MVVGQHEPVPFGLGTDQRRPKHRPTQQITHRGPLCGGHRCDLFFHIVATVGGQVDIAPRRRRIDFDDLHRLSEPVTETRSQLRVPADHQLHRVSETARVQLAGNADGELHRIQFVVIRSRDGVKQQSLLQWRQRQDVNDPILLLQLVDLRLVQSGWCDVRWAQPAPTLAHMCADPAQGLNPQPAQPVDALFIQNRRRITPLRLQPRATFAVHSDGVEFHRMR